MKVQKKGKRRIALRTVTIVVLPLLLVAVRFCNAFIPREAADVYCTKVFPKLSLPLQSFNMYFQNSLTENIVVCFVPLLVAGFVVWLVILIRKFLSRGALVYLYKTARDVLIIAIIGAVLFQAMHGINYKRTHVIDSLKLTEEELTYEDYCSALQWAYFGMIDARSRLGEDYNGVAHMKESFENSATYANSLVDAFCEKYEVPISTNYVRVKPVALSHYWSYTHIVGMYDAYLAEVNVNTDYENITEFPITMCHELCHAKGYASETDCNTLAALACCSADRADFRYAGYYEIFWNLYYVAENLASKKGENLPDYLSASDMVPVFKDATAAAIYWDQIDKEVASIKEYLGIDIKKASNAANDAFLKSNGESGVDSYVVPDSSYVRFYLTHVEGAEDA